MFESLSNAMKPTAKKAKVAETVSSPNDKEQDLNVHDIKQNLPNFQIEPLEDFDTIDDSVLANLIYDIDGQDTNPPQRPNDTAKATVPVTTQNNQVINYNNMQNLPRFPAMFFPNSNITINYNFAK